MYSLYYFLIPEILLCKLATSFSSYQLENLCGDLLRDTQKIGFGLGFLTGREANLDVRM